MKELEKKELMEVDGGFPWVAMGLAVFVQIVCDWDNFERGLMGKPCRKD